MFADVGWGEIAIIVLIGLVVIGPERLPDVLRDLKVAIAGAREAVAKTRQDLSDTMGPEFEDFRKPLQQIAELQRMGPKAALTQTLFEGDNYYLEAFDPKKIMAGETAGQAHREGEGTQVEKVERSDVAVSQPEAQAAKTAQAAQSAQPARTRQGSGVAQAAGAQQGRTAQPAPGAEQAQSAKPQAQDPQPDPEPRASWEDVT